MSFNLIYVWNLHKNSFSIKSCRAKKSGRVRDGVRVVVGLIATGGRNGNGIMLIQINSCWTFMKDYFVSHLQHVAFVPRDNEHFQPHKQNENSWFIIILEYYKIQQSFFRIKVLIKVKHIAKFARILGST